ncbi:autophagy-related protein 22 [Zymoseptoria brevis]|uniref:Autophagy-related protein n=1 Tax=Zymoseptoria brevis TaxID=1047168 RepID=A0A0F4GF67_9PEZI|nr:autophagy-related protein 22 [Zymoseptoria brevis]
MTTSNDTDTTHKAPSYPEEDTRPTSKQELLGFYAYSFAAEVFVVCGVGAFIPITLEELARASPSAVLAHDRSKPCLATNGINEDSRKGSQCVFELPGGLVINTASFAMYTFSISVFIQALLVVTMSGAADHGSYRKSLMIGFAVTGSVATMLYLPITPSLYLLGALWAIIGNVCFGASFVLLNSFLPLLVRWHPDARESKKTSPQMEPDDEYAHPTISDARTPLLPADGESESHPRSSAMQLSTRISSYGIGIGYIAAVCTQLFSLLILSTSTITPLFALKLVLFTIGLWWLLFTIPAAILLRPRPGPPLQINQTRTRLHNLVTYITSSWRSLLATLTHARRLRDVLTFLTAWFFLSDAIATISSTAILFAKTTLAMSPSSLALINLTVTLSGILAAFTWPHVSRYFAWTPLRTILICTALFELIPLYGLLGYVPFLRNIGVFGLQQPWEMFPLSVVYGVVMGGLSSYCRSLFADLIPEGREAQFFALYAITDKGSSVIGPAVVGWIVGRFGEIRPAFGFLSVVMAVGGGIMWRVDVERGRREGKILEEEGEDVSR